MLLFMYSRKYGIKDCFRKILSTEGCQHKVQSLEKVSIFKHNFNDSHHIYSM